MDQANRADRAELMAEETVIPIPNLTREIVIMHMTDIHMTAVDDREGEDVRKMAGERGALFLQLAGGVPQQETFETQISLCNRMNVDAAVFTGDIIDFPSQANLELLKQGYASLEAPYLYTLGNHDWSYPHLPVDDALRAQSYAEFRDWSERVPGCEALTVGGVKLIAVDNSNYQLTDGQLQFIKQQADEGLPCLLFMHIPLYLPSLEPEVTRVWKAPIMMTAEGWTDDARHAWSLRENDAATEAFAQWVREDEDCPVVGIFCGHVHFAHADAFREGRYQYVTPAGYACGMRVIRLKPAENECDAIADICSTMAEFETAGADPGYAKGQRL